MQNRTENETPTNQPTRTSRPLPGELAFGDPDGTVSDTTSDTATNIGTTGGGKTPLDKKK
jgi:hypothetical protein